MSLTSWEPFSTASGYRPPLATCVSSISSPFLLLPPPSRVRGRQTHSCSPFPANETLQGVISQGMKAMEWAAWLSGPSSSAQEADGASPVTLRRLILEHLAACMAHPPARPQILLRAGRLILRIANTSAARLSTAKAVYTLSKVPLPPAFLAWDSPNYGNLCSLPSTHGSVSLFSISPLAEPSPRLSPSRLLSPIPSPRPVCVSSLPLPSLRLPWENLPLPLPSGLHH